MDELTRDLVHAASAGAAALVALDRADRVKAAAAARLDEASPTPEDLVDRAARSLSLETVWDRNRLTGRQHLTLLHGVRLEGRTWLRGQAEFLQERLDPDDHPATKGLAGWSRDLIGSFFDRVEDFLHNLLFAGVLSLSSPQVDAHKAEPVRKAVEQAVADHVRQFLAPFRVQVLSDSVPVDATFVARVEQYGSFTWTGTQAVQRTVARHATIFGYESREHFGIDPTDICNGCAAEIAKGIVPIGTLKSIGSCQCKSSCHCAFNYFETEDGPEYNTIFNGRGPLDPAVFGATSAGDNF